MLGHDNIPHDNFFGEHAEEGDSNTSVPMENLDQSLLVKTGLESKTFTGGAALLDRIKFSNTV